MIVEAAGRHVHGPGRATADAPVAGVPLEAAWSRLQALVDWERASRARMRVDLAPERDLMARLGEPQQRLRTVHVTGTKGKGSVCALIEAGLLHAGWRAGRYGSPHIEHVTERVSHRGRPIAEGLLALALNRALDARDAACREGTPARRASWFDVMTAAAFWSFAEAGLEWAVVEVGLGGLLDSTNIVQPDLAIVTNVDLEHTEVLGATVEAIAFQKAGIFKSGKPALTAIAPASPAGQVLAQVAQACGAELRWVDLGGEPGLRAANLALARAALGRLGEAGVHSPARGRPLGGEDLPASVAGATNLPGRLEVLDLCRHRQAGGGPGGATTRVVLDGAHVGFAVTAALDELRLDPAHAAKPVVLLALGPDKNAPDIVARLAARAAFVVCTRLHDDRPSWDPGELARLCRRQQIASVSVDSPLDGLERCLDQVASGAWVLVTGSLHLVGTARRHLLGAGDVDPPRPGPGPVRS